MNKRNYRIVFVIYVFTILAVSSIPGNSLPRIVILSPDKLLHMLEYGLLGYFAIKSFGYNSIIPISVGVFIFAGLDEYWQSFTPGRWASLLDIVADILGFLIVTGTMYYYQWKSRDK